MAKKQTIKFHQFSRLPLELRTQIWNLTEADLRIVQVSSRPANVTHDHLAYVKSPTRPPAILHACSESRRSALARSLYVKAFCSGTRPRYTWINFEVDMITLKPIFFDPIKPEKHLIRRLRMEGPLDENFCYFRAREMRDFTSIKEVHIVCTDGLAPWRQVIDDFYLGTYNVKFFDKTASGRMLDWQGMEKTFPSTLPQYDEEED
ncbi:hypothetical protein HJFPF1_10957 [Paramyrothecium foliicola]|nr:hypothetical protein HJFPF1_10957 [Paramyrothecium foliicola]